MASAAAAAAVASMVVASVMAEGSSCCSGGDWMVLVLESGAEPVAVESSSGERTQCGRRYCCNPCRMGSRGCSPMPGTNAPGSCRTPSKHDHHQGGIAGGLWHSGTRNPLSMSWLAETGGTSSWPCSDCQTVHHTVIQRHSR